MNFYSVWSDAIDLGVDDTGFIHSFLNSVQSSLIPLIEGTREEQEKVVKVLSKVSANRLVECIIESDIDRELETADIPCFSNFENGVVRLNELLEFAPDGLTYSEIGQQLINAPTQVAQMKYGENHAKLAAIISLVTIDDTHRPGVVKATALGRFLTGYSLVAKSDIFRKLLMRNPCVKCILFYAKKGGVCYHNVVKTLSDSTAYRRRTSVRQIMEFVLNNSESRDLLGKIDWGM